MASRAAKRYLLAIDLGSSRTRCIVTDLRGRVAGEASADTRLESPESLAPLGKELNPDRTWASIGLLVKRALRSADARANQVLAAAATSQRQGFTLLGSTGNELYMGPNTDLRAFFEGQSLDESYGPEVYRITGHTPSFLFAPAKLRWFEAHRPDILTNTRAILSLDAWVGYKLCGETAVERSSAAEIGLLNTSKGEWAQDLLGKLGVPQQILPPLLDAGSRLGTVTSRAASATGLVPGTPVIAAGPDTQCGLLGLGVTEPGQVGIVAGWSAPAQLVLDRFQLDEAARTWTGRHLLEGRWALESNATEAGSAYRWAARNLNTDGRVDIHRHIDALAAKSPPGANGALAFLGPRPSDMGNVGSRWGGFLFPLLSDTMPVERADLFRAVLENLGFALKSNVDQLKEISGVSPSAIRFGGGMARGKTLRRILADVLGQEVAWAKSVEVPGIGAAMCAAAGIGLHAGLRDAAQAMWNPAKPIKPDPVEALEYEEHYERWVQMGTGLESLEDRL